MASLPQCLSARLRDAGAVFDQPVDRDTKTVPCRQSGSTEFADHTVVIASADDLFGALVTGSVSTRASKYSLCSRTCGDVSSCGLQDGQHGRGPPEVEQSLAVRGNMLVMAGVR